MKPLAWIGSFLLIPVLLVTAIAFVTKQYDIPEKHIEVVLRDIGHQLLLTAKDSTSRVLPVKKINAHTYQLSFQNAFSLVSDSLIDLVQREFRKTDLSTHYIVNLRNCEKKETILAFEIGSPAGSLTPCRGRRLATACYLVEIELLKKNRFSSFWLLLLLIPLTLTAWYVKNKFRKKEVAPVLPDNKNAIPLGRFTFYPDNNVLKTGSKTIALSENETKALTIFANNPGQIVERETLMKEIWEDKGIVVISRNVDVLVSKLRKKLSENGSIKFITVPGRGYKFSIE